MRYSTPVLLAGLATATHTRRSHKLASRATAFPAGTVFDIVLTGSNGLAEFQQSSAPVIDIDLEDHEDIISELAKTKTVICYFSAGSREDWRSDVNSFNAADWGQEVDGWKGENWLDVTSANVREIMRLRIERAAKAGCHAVDPDNVDGYVSSPLLSPMNTSRRNTLFIGLVPLHVVSTNQ